MTGARIEVSFDDKAMVEAFNRLGARFRGPALRNIGVALVETTNKRFEAGTDPDGRPWKGLLPAYAAIKRGPGILRASLMLQRSITFRVSGQEIEVGSNRIYAAVHQFGGVIKARNKPYLAFFLGSAGSGPQAMGSGNRKRGKGGKFASGRTIVHVTKVTIPARPYLGFGRADQTAVTDVLQGEIDAALRG